MLPGCVYLDGPETAAADTVETMEREARASDLCDVQQARLQIHFLTHTGCPSIYVF